MNVIVPTESETVAVNVDVMTIIGMIATEPIAIGKEIGIEIDRIGIDTIESVIIGAAVDGLAAKAQVVIAEEKAVHGIGSATDHVLAKEVLTPRTGNAVEEIFRLRLNRSYKI